jgi:hypothetical protein
VDVNDFWQENKRFVMSVAGGALVFLTGIVLIKNLFGSELNAAARPRPSVLARPLYRRRIWMHARG